MGPLRSQLRYCPLISALLLTARVVAAQQLPIAGIARVGVSDADKAQAFYTGMLGFPRVHESPGGAAIYKVSDHQYIEISPGLSPREDVRLTYIALETPDVRLLRGCCVLAGCAGPRP
jgi:hypothetical protein